MTRYSYVRSVEIGVYTELKKFVDSLLITRLAEAPPGNESIIIN